MGKGLVLWVRAEEGDHSSRDKNNRQKGSIFHEMFQSLCKPKRSKIRFSK